MIEVKNEAKLALKDMPEEQAVEIFLAWLRGQELECVYEVGRDWTPRLHPQAALSYTLVYRTAPITLVHDTIDVAHVHPDFRWMARDYNGSANFFEVMPIKYTDKSWITVEGRMRSTEAFDSYIRGTTPWDQSLVDLDALRRERGIPVKVEE